MSILIDVKKAFVTINQNNIIVQTGISGTAQKWMVTKLPNDRKQFVEIDDCASILLNMLCTTMLYTGMDN